MQINQLKQRAQHLLNKGQLEQAKALYEKIREENSMDAESFYMLGSINGQLGRFREATEYYREVIRLEPRAVVAHCGLGAALQAQGKLTEAKLAFQEALRLQPKSQEIQLEIVKILVQQRKYSDAEQRLRHILKLNPSSEVALFGLGEIHYNRREWQHAVDCYERALKISPSQANIHCQLGNAQNALTLYDQAEIHYRQAMRIAPRLLPAYTGLGRTLAATGRAAEARTVYTNALRIDPDNVEAIVAEAELSEQEGDFTSAYERLAPIAKSGIAHPGLAVTYAKLCHKNGYTRDAIDYLELWLQNRGDTTSSTESIHFALGKLLDAVGDYDKAFKHYHQGNELIPYNGDDTEYTIEFEKIIQTFDWNFMIKAPRATFQTERPVFIVGMPRSGTTLTEQILASHPNVFGAGELIYIHDLATSLSTQLGTELPFPESMNKLTTGILDTVANTYLDRLHELDPNAARVTDKMPQNFIFLGFISLLFPSARVIHCKRDPRDTCLSNYFQHSTIHQYASRLQSLGTYYRQYEKLMQHWRSLLEIPILEVNYENLVANLEQESHKLIEFVGLEWDKNCLEFHKTRRYVATPSYDQVRQPIYKQSVGRWRNYERHIGPLLQALGL